MVDGERNFRVEAIADQDPSRRSRRRGRRPGAGAARARGSRRGGGSNGSGRVRPRRHSLREPHAHPTQPEPGARLTGVLGATYIPVTAGIWDASRSVRFRPDVTTPFWRAPASPFRPGLRQPRFSRRRPGVGGCSGDPRVAWMTSPPGPLSGQGGRVFS